jgi:hypothetical protein
MALLEFFNNLAIGKYIIIVSFNEVVQQHINEQKFNKARTKSKQK